MSNDPFFPIDILLLYLMIYFFQSTLAPSWKLRRILIVTNTIRIPYRNWHSWWVCRFCCLFMTLRLPLFSKKYEHSKDACHFVFFFFSSDICFYLDDLSLSEDLRAFMRSRGKSSYCYKTLYANRLTKTIIWEFWTEIKVLFQRKTDLVLM